MKKVICGCLVCLFALAPLSEVAWATDKADRKDSTAVVESGSSDKKEADKTEAKKEKKKPPMKPADALLSKRPTANGKMEKAFDEDTEELKKANETAYGWEDDLGKVRYWKTEIGGKDMVDFERQAGWQEEFLGDLLETTSQHLDLQGSGRAGNKKSGAAEVVTMALGEVGTKEEPPGSGINKYTKWFFGKEVEEKKPWSTIFISYLMNKNKLDKDGFWKKTASRAAAYKNLTGTLGFKAYTLDQLENFGGNAYKAKQGDLLFFGEHIGLVTSASSGLDIVVGDYDGEVKKLSVKKDDEEFKDAELVAMEYPKSDYTDGDQAQNKETVFRFLTDEMGYSAAAACGVMANIQHESGFVADINEFSGGGGYGICQWTGGRRTSLVSWCKNNGYSEKTLEGQLWYLKHETEGTYAKINDYMIRIPNTADGAYEAGRYWCAKWERPLDQVGQPRSRGQMAKNKYWPTFGR
ncbi:phage tail tip lysozyme [Peptococcus simiae]|uniref:phage tail tip lysozyme n=1 Tax=Peptococcus simiae TaxID=1643805 RepID=UPI0039803A88